MFTPSEAILKKYADVLIKFALGSGNGIKKGEAVFLQVPESAKPILNPLVKAVLETGGYPIISYVPEGTDRWMGVDRVFFEKANPDQIKYFPKNYFLGRVKDADHMVSIISSNNKHELEGIDAKKILARQAAAGFYKAARDKKENSGKLTWTLALFGTEAMAKEAGLSLNEYWDQIINACFLEEKNPIKKWKSVSKQIDTYQRKLNALEIENLRIEGRNVDLTIGVGKTRQWLGGSGRNIPSFEIFTSPDFRKTEGWVKFNQPLYVYGNLVKDVELQFTNGRVTRVKASQNVKLIKEMLKVKGADRLGEFSLTDKRFSRITHFMAETLYDENMGGAFGNFHLALGSAYKEAFKGDIKKMKKEDWEKIGFNESAVHTDIVSTDDKTVTAFLPDGSTKVIYKDGIFLL